MTRGNYGTGYSSPRATIQRVLLTRTTTIFTTNELPSGHHPWMCMNLTATQRVEFVNEIKGILSTIAQGLLLPGY